MQQTRGACLPAQAGGLAGHNRCPMQVFSHHRHALDLPPGHRFPMPKYDLLRNRVEAECTGLRNAVELATSAPR